MTPLLAATNVAPTCPYPQALASPASLLGTSAYASAMAWNGKEFAVIWHDPSAAVPGVIRFQRLFADGKPVASALTIASGTADKVGIVWNGSGYGIVWDGVTSPPQIFFARLDPNGTIVSGPTRISYYNTPSPTLGGSGPTIAWNGNGYAVVFCEYPALGVPSDVYAALLNVNGVVTNAEIPVAVASGYQESPSVVWSPTAASYVLAWDDYRSGVRKEIATASILANGSYTYNGIVVSAAGSSFEPWLASNGNSIGMTWYDTRDRNGDGNSEIYFATLSPGGNKIGADVRVTNDVAASLYPHLIWIGGEYGLFWFDARTSPGYYLYDLWYQRLTLTGTPYGVPTSLTYGADLAYYAAAFATHGYLLAYDSAPPPFGTPLTILPWGCSYPYAPSCPEAPDAYGITGSSATVAWLSGTDPYTDIAYYQVFRNAALVGTTANTFVNDTGLSPNATYQYNIRTVNAADLYSSPCPDAQIYVKSSASLSLNVGKSATDVNLTWTDSSGQNTYRVMRGTSPQTMSEIDRTSATNATDPNAVLGAVCYFYSIDVPQS